MKFATKAIHAGVHPDPSTGAVMTPIFQTTTYAQKTPGDHKGYEYARTQNPTRTALEKSCSLIIFPVSIERETLYQSDSVIRGFGKPS